MKKIPKQLLTVLLGTSVLWMVGCTSLKTPATANVAVSNAAVNSAANAGAVQYAPDEMVSAREKLALANQALHAKDYKAAVDWAAQAQADAKLAQSKADSAKAQAAAAALQEDIRILRDELNRASQ